MCTGVRSQSRTLPPSCASKSASAVPHEPAPSTAISECTKLTGCSVPQIGGLKGHLSAMLRIKRPGAAPKLSARALLPDDEWELLGQDSIGVIGQNPHREALLARVLAGKQSLEYPCTAVTTLALQRDSLRV